jgi:hypothetical protein
MAQPCIEFEVDVDGFVIPNLTVVDNCFHIDTSYWIGITDHACLREWELHPPITAPV